MKILKVVALFLLGLLLFLSLSAFGLAFTLNGTVLNSRFVNSELNKLHLSSLAGELLSQQTTTEGLPPEARTAVINAITRVEPALKQQIALAINSIYDYLHGKRQNTDLALILKNTILSRDFIVSVVDQVDIAPLVREALTQQVGNEIPRELKVYLDASLDTTILQLKPWIRQQVSAAADPVVDYLLGRSRSLNVVIPLDQPKDILRQNLRDAFLNSPPPQLAGASQAELEQYFGEFYQQFSMQIPSTYEIDANLLGTEIPTTVTKGLAEVEQALEQARQGVGYFQLIYLFLIVFILLLILGIILIHRQVKGATRDIGIIFLCYGAFEYAGVLVAKNVAGAQMVKLDIPSSFQVWLPHLLNDSLAPLQALSLGFLIGGIVLIIVSLVYKPEKPQA